MADIEATGVNESIVLSAEATDRIVIVKNPDTLTGGTILFDKTIPSGKILTGSASILGRLSVEE